MVRNGSYAETRAAVPSCAASPRGPSSASTCPCARAGPGADAAQQTAARSGGTQSSGRSGCSGSRASRDPSDELTRSDDWQLSTNFAARIA